MRSPSPGVAIRRAAVEPSATGDRRTVELAVRVAIIGAIAFQVFQRAVNNGYELSTYGRSLWYVSYEFGFVRRGLAGELLRRAVGHTPTVPEVALAQNVVAVVTVAACAWLVIVVLRQRTVIATGVAALLAVSPFGFDFVGGSKRPDLVAFVVFALVAVWAASRAREAMLLGLVGGALLAVSVLFSEAGPLVVGPWLALVVAASGRAQGRSRWESNLAMLCSVVPSALVLAVVAGVGRASLDAKTALEQVAPLDVGGRGTVFPYLDDTIGDSIAKVSNQFPIWSFVVGAVLLGAIAFVARQLRPFVCSTARWVLPTRASRRLWFAGFAGSALVLFGLGFDWMRWITSIMFCGSLAVAAIVAIIGRADRVVGDRPLGSEQWYRPLPSRVALSLPAVATLGVAVYLLALPPLPTAVTGLSNAAHLLMNAPGR